MVTIPTDYPQPPTDLYPLLAQGMGVDLAWCPEDVSLNHLAATLVGMANSEGGTIILGIAPRSAQIHSLKDPSAAIDRVFQAALLADPPLVLPIPQVYSIGGATRKNILWISIPAGLPNVYNLAGSYLGREGRHNGPLPARRLRQLLIERGVFQFESQLPEGAVMDDFDPVQVEEYCDVMRAQASMPQRESSQTSDLEILLRRGCVQKIEHEYFPTYAGLLLFGRYPQQWLPNAGILATRFSGKTFSDHFIKQNIQGSLPRQLNQAITFVSDNLRSVVRLTGLTHQNTLEYPLEAVRELLVNAVAHRDYNLQGDDIHLNIFSNRLEVQSPGRLPGPVNLNNLLDARFSRNAVIVQVLADLGYIERLGYGLDRVVAVLRQLRMRPPRFEETAGCFKVTLSASDESLLEAARPEIAPYLEMELNPRQIMALEYLVTHRRITSSAYQELCPQVHSETLRRDLAGLVQRGILIKVGEKRATFYILKKLSP